MEIKSKLGFTILLIVVSNLLSFKKMGEIDCKINEEIKICVSKVIDKKRQELFFVISYTNIKGQKMDSIYYDNQLAFQFYAKDSILAITEKLDTLKTFSYVFEDRFDNILPSYKQIVGFKKGKNKINQLIIKNCGIHQSFNLNN
jgi:hypothetical protein